MYSTIATDIHTHKMCYNAVHIATIHTMYIHTACVCINLGLCVC